MLTLRVILQANTDRIAIVAAACAVGALAGMSVVYLALIFSGDRVADFW
jgi:hypothetical protein